MASSSLDPKAKFGRGRLSSQTLVVKEGFLVKKGGILRSWNKRYFILNKQSLVYFKREQEDFSKLSPLGRIFLSDVVRIDKNKKDFVFVVYTKKHEVSLQAAGEAEKEEWIKAIEGATASEGEAEKQDPFRKTLRKLAPGLKRVTLMKDPEKGIGCTIKSAAGHIFVNRIIEDGPIAHTGVLRPDDELLDVNGINIMGMSVAEVGQVIRTCPEEFLATVRPITAHKKVHPPDVTRVNYVTVLPVLSFAKEETATFQIADATLKSSSCDSLTDVGNYEDEDNGSPPPIPAHTEEMLQDPPGPEDDMPSPPAKVALSSRRPRHVYEDVRTNYMDVEIKPTLK